MHKTESSTTKPSYPSPAFHHQLIVSRHYYCCLAMFPSLGSLYELHRNRVQWILWGYILRIGFWFIFILFYSLGKNKSLIFPYRFQFLITVESSLFCVCLSSCIRLVLRWFIPPLWLGSECPHTTCLNPCHKEACRALTTHGYDEVNLRWYLYFEILCIACDIIHVNLL